MPAKTAVAKPSPFRRIKTFTMDLPEGPLGPKAGSAAASSGVGDSVPAAGPPMPAAAAQDPDPPQPADADHEPGGGMATATDGAD